MYLKSIRADGFKSFAEKIEFDLKKGITGIVGPNGSGKSNVVDAVRWVLGETSAKALRTTNTSADVIFAGSKTRSSSSRASVALTFDNSDYYLNSDLTEIEIKRVAYRDGENEYFINNAKVRLKDITNLFIDSGASKESFNIISQGAVTDVINSKPEERRAMFESAAGVLKYKKRKEEANRKLDKTKDNLDKISLITNELETNLEPLKEQAEIATKYLEFKKELESIEIALIANDITEINSEYSISKNLINKINEEILNIATSNTDDSVKLEECKNEIIKIDENISRINNNILVLTEEIAKLNSEKLIMIERKKYQGKRDSNTEALITLKEEKLRLQKNFDSLNKELELLNANLLKNEKENNEIVSLINIKKSEIASKSGNLNLISKKNYDLNNKINILEQQIENDTTIPYAVKCVLNNPRLKGIHNVIAKLIDIPKDYVLAITTALGYGANVIVVDNEQVIKESISYLKENKLGRATFFPINIIKPKFVETNIINRLSKVEGFIGIASELVSYDMQYENIIKNQLGNTLVVKNIDAMNLIGRIVEYKYRIVSLTGELLHSGGSVTGGSDKNNKNIINNKYELLKLKAEFEANEIQVNEINNELSVLTEELTDFDSKLYDINKEIINLKEIINRKKISIKEVGEELEIKISESKSLDNLGDNKTEEVDKVLEEFYKKSTEKEILEKDLAAIKGERINLNDFILELENNARKINSEYNKKQNELKNLEIKVGKMDVKLDNLLNNLSENYNITYEKAEEMYSLDMEIDIARTKVNSLKFKIRELGEVNTGSIAEYERINTRYTFLTNQKNDLTQSIDKLNDIIEEMDRVMKERFLETFNQIKAEFAIVFKKLFKGGEGILELSNPDDLLETGIEISAMPPGKKLNSIVLLSGGEKTLTAIALLFAIINVKTVPFCILDEVEAALDESNVDTFGKYLVSKKDLSQFIIITHKKRTMEYVDVLYGITMQESGVSKLVSVELATI